MFKKQNSPIFIYMILYSIIFFLLYTIAFSPNIKIDESIIFDKTANNNLIKIVLFTFTGAIIGSCIGYFKALNTSLLIENNKLLSQINTNSEYKKSKEIKI